MLEHLLSLPNILTFIFLVIWIDGMFLGQLIVTYRLTEKGISVWLFRVIKLKTVLYKDISAIHKVRFKDFFSTPFRTLLLNSRVFGSRVAIEKIGVLNRIFITPHNPDAFIAEVAKHLKENIVSTTSLQKSKKKILPFLLVYMFAVIIVRVVFGQVDAANLDKDRILTESGVQTTATITKLDCSNHSAIEYAFIVSGQNYSSRQTATNCDSSSVGQQITVTYVPLNPTISIPGGTDGLLLSELIAVWLVSIIFPAFVIAVIYSRGTGSGTTQIQKI